MVVLAAAFMVVSKPSEWLIAADRGVLQAADELALEASESAVEGYATRVAAQRHGPAGPSWFEPERGWVRVCLCGREFESHEGWPHVPALFSHIATMPIESRTITLPGLA